MSIQFIYVQIKENLDEFIFIINNKHKDNVLDLNRIIYSKLYHNNHNIDNDINYFKLFYIKEGFKINFNIEIWNKLIYQYYKTLNIINLIDSKYLNLIKLNDCLFFNYKKYKNEIDNIIIESILLDK